MLNPSRVVSKTELTDHLYEQDFDRDSNVIEVFVGRLRRSGLLWGTAWAIERKRPKAELPDGSNLQTLR